MNHRDTEVQRSEGVRLAGRLLAAVLVLACALVLGGCISRWGVADSQLVQGQGSLRLESQPVVLEGAEGAESVAEVPAMSLHVDSGTDAVVQGKGLRLKLGPLGEFTAEEITWSRNPSASQKLFEGQLKAAGEADALAAASYVKLAEVVSGNILAAFTAGQAASVAKQQIKSDAKVQTAAINAAGSEGGAQ